MVNKGKGKPPRDLYIPTIRDRLLLKAMNNFLSKIYEAEIDQKMPQMVIRDVKNILESNKYDSFIKVDIKSFYPSINVDILFRIIKKKVRGQVFIRLLKQALNPKNAQGSSKIDGVPQGLSISNTLAYIYLIDIDCYFNLLDDVEYFRYVDDIFILCKKSDSVEIIADLMRLFESKKLTLHPIEKSGSKSKFGSISLDTFDYLGYMFSNGKVTVRNSSVNTMRIGLVEIFTAYKYATNKNPDFLRWRLDLKISGCIHEGKMRGWLFFFSQINDLSLIYELDHFVKILSHKFKVESILPTTKKFSTAFFEITHNLSRTKYIPNFDKFSHEEKVKVLESYFKFTCSGLSEEEVDYNFQKRIKKQVNKLLADPKNFS